MEETDHPLLLTGKAGTGKSTLLRYFRDRTRKNVAVLAPTGVAALNVEGETVHSFFRFGPDVTVEKAAKAKPREKDVYRNLDAIVIDEISMVRADLFDCVDAFLKVHGKRRGEPFGGTQMILIGDLYQLPPVVTSRDREAFRTRYTTPYFFSAHAFAALSPEFVELERVYRQKDEGFIGVLNAIRNNTVTDEHLEVLNRRVDPAADPGPRELVVCLTPTNRAADEINARRLTALPGKERLLCGKAAGEITEGAFPAPEDLPVKPGAQIMMVNNDSEERWVNGSLGRIVRIRKARDGPDILEVELTDASKVEVEPHTWDLFRYVWNRKTSELETESRGSYTQYPLRLAWAVTIHKSQGKTFDRVIVDLGRGAFATGQVYVAMSRCTTLAGLTLRRPLRKRDVFVDWRIVKFVTSWQYAHSEAEMPLAAKLEVIREAIRDHRPLSILYLKARDERSRRTITPEEVGEMHYRGKPFIGVRAFCHLRRSSRVFRVDRILELVLTGPAG